MSDARWYIDEEGELCWHTNWYGRDRHGMPDVLLEATFSTWLPSRYLHESFLAAIPLCALKRRDIKKSYRQIADRDEAYMYMLERLAAKVLG